MTAPHKERSPSACEMQTGFLLFGRHLRAVPPRHTLLARDAGWRVSSGGSVAVGFFRVRLAAGDSYRDTLKNCSVASLPTAVAVLPSLPSVKLKLAIPLPPMFPSLRPAQPLVSTETLSTLNCLLTASYE
jgi:hypothetical protein